MTRVRMRVATSGATFSTPTLAKTAVSAAKPADPRAHSNQLGTNRVSCLTIGLSVKGMKGSKVVERYQKARRNLGRLKSRRTSAVHLISDSYGSDDLRPGAARASGAQ